MSILLIVNESPWGSSLIDTALRFCRAAGKEKQIIQAVFFHGEGVYNAVESRQSDPGLARLPDAWSELHRQQGTQLMLCSGSAARRLSPESSTKLPPGFREAGLVEMFALMDKCDQVVSF